MNITIGINASPRELDLELDLSEDELFAQVTNSLREQTPLILREDTYSRPSNFLRARDCAADAPRRLCNSLKASRNQLTPIHLRLTAQVDSFHALRMLNTQSLSNSICIFGRIR